MEGWLGMIGGYTGAASFFLGVAFVTSLFTAIKMRGERTFTLSSAVVGVCWLLVLHLFIASHK